jgi:hypothetical protein
VVIIPSVVAVAVLVAVTAAPLIITARHHQHALVLRRLGQKLERLPLALRNGVAAGVAMQRLVVVAAAFVVEAALAQVFAARFVAGGGSSLEGCENGSLSVCVEKSCTSDEMI